MAKPRSWRKAILPMFCIMGIAFLSYVAGAAAIFFELPSSAWLDKAFIGARAWHQQEQEPMPASAAVDAPVTHGDVDVPEKTCDGYTLYACASVDASNTQAFLMDMRGQVIHRWSIPFSQIWPNPPHIQGHVKDALVCFFGCHLDADGNLLVVMHGVEQLANGYGLVKLDKDSKVVWKHAANIHHDVDVGEDGTIYAIEHVLVGEMPEGLEHIPVPCLADRLLKLSPDGKLIGEPISILDAFRGTPYVALLRALDRRPRGDVRPPGRGGPPFEPMVLRMDALHTNYVKALSRTLAPRFPRFKAGQLLISMRHLDTIAVLDPDQKKIVWADSGPWQAQHDPQFLDNGHLLIFDNRGLAKSSRVLEYDPATQAFPWTYAGEHRPAFYSSERGMSQRLPNGNTFIVNSEGRELLEVTPGKEVVWAHTMDRFITTARRYSANELRFLKPGQCPRPLATR